MTAAPPEPSAPPASRAAARRAFDADVAILGAGAAGLFCAAQAAARGRSVVVFDHARRLAEKIRISGGGRCNFTNRGTTAAQFVSENPAFCRSALARYTAADFIALVQRHRIPFHEKHKGQLFCDESSERIIELLVHECERHGVQRRQPCAVAAVRHRPPAAGAALEGGPAVAGSGSDRASGSGGFELDTEAGPVLARRVVVATGGLSIPQIGASDFGLRLARQFGHRVVEPRPALVPLTFEAEAWAPYAALAGVALPVHIEAGEGRQAGRFDEDLLFTHRGLSGPAVLQASTYWRPGSALRIDLAPGGGLLAALQAAKAAGRRHLGNELAEHLPVRLAERWLATLGLDGHRPMAEQRDRDLARLAEALSRWTLQPKGTEGWKKAEVMAGGVDTRELSSQTMESRRVPGLYFIGEVVDVTGWLGGYNFQWAWSSAHACAEALAAG